MNFFDSKGSISVEASIVVPIVILCLMVLMLAAVLCFQETLGQAAADLTAERGADFWDNSRKDLDTGRIVKANLLADGLYSRLFEPFRDRKLDRIKESLKQPYRGYGLKVDSTSVKKAEIDDWIVYKKIDFTMTDSGTIPKSKHFNIFGLDSRYSQTDQAVAVAADPAEFIRNTDFIIDLEKELEGKFHGLKNLGEKTRGAISDMQKKTEDFFK